MGWCGPGLAMWRIRKGIWALLLAVEIGKVVRIMWHACRAPSFYIPCLRYSIYSASAESSDGRAGVWKLHQSKSIDRTLVAWAEKRSQENLGSPPNSSACERYVCRWSYKVLYAFRSSTSWWLTKAFDFSAGDIRDSGDFGDVSGFRSWKKAARNVLMLQGPAVSNWDPEV